MLSVTKDTPSRYPGTCELCGCHTDLITRHHLFPRQVTRKADKRGFPFTPEQKESVADMCWPCHCIVHRLILADVLASEFHSIDRLKTHGGVRAWLHWVQGKSMQYLHSLMIPCPPKPPEVQKVVKGKRGPAAFPKVQAALDTIWAENQGGFPRWEGKGGKTRGHALRQQVRRLAGNTVQKPEIEAAMKTNPVYQEWEHWVFSERRRSEVT